MKLARFGGKTGHYSQKLFLADAGVELPVRVGKFSNCLFFDTGSEVDMLNRGQNQIVITEMP